MKRERRLVWVRREERTPTGERKAFVVRERADYQVSILMLCPVIHTEIYKNLLIVIFLLKKKKKLAQFAIVLYIITSCTI